MIDNTALFRARVKTFNVKRQSGAAGLPVPTRPTQPKSQRQASQAFKQYSAQARLILHDISELRDLVLDKRKEYIMCSGSLTTYSFTTIMSEADRLRFESDSDTALKQCTKLVQFFQTQINSDRTLRRDDELNHLRLVSQLLVAYLRQISALIEQLRSIYRRQSERMRKICRLANLVEKYERSIDDAHRAERERVDEAERRRREARGSPSDAENIALTEASKHPNEATTKQSRKFDAENRQKLQLDDKSKSQRVRVYDFTSGSSKTRLKEPRADGKIVTISDGWSELDDSTLFDDDDQSQSATEHPSSSNRSAVNVDSGCVSDRFAIANDGNGDAVGDGWSDAELDFSIDEQSATETVVTSTRSGSSTVASSTTSLSKKSKQSNEASKFGGKSITKVELMAVEEITSPSDDPLADRELSRAEQEQLVMENRKLFDKFAHSDEDILHIGRQLTEIERLQNTFAEKVSEQENDINHIHTQTIYTLDNLEAANQFIRDAIKNSASRRVIALFCLLVLTFTLLFLDWYNP